MLPSQDVVVSTFAAQHPLSRPKAQAEVHTTLAPSKRTPFPAWSAIDDAKDRAEAFKKEAVREYEVASKKAQATTGKIEPWTAKYYAACTFGGMLACVSIHPRAEHRSIEIHSR